MSLQRIARHLVLPHWSVRRAFDAATLQAIDQAISDTERSHGGEIRFAVDASAHPIDLMRGITPRHQAMRAFARLGVWDTEANNGVLIYVSWADRDVEIVADRGIHRHVGEASWQAICRDMETACAAGDYEAGVLRGIAAISAELARAFPKGEGGDELPNRPVVI